MNPHKIYLLAALLLAGSAGLAQTYISGDVYHSGHVYESGPSVTVTAGATVRTAGEWTLWSPAVTFDAGASLLSAGGSSSLHFANPTAAGLSAGAATFNAAGLDAGGVVLKQSNPSGVDVLGGVLASGTVEIADGITTTPRAQHQAEALRLADGAAFSGSFSDSRHVNGYVSKVGDDAFSFPVGSGANYRPLEISAPVNAAAHLSAAWFAGSPDAVQDPSDAATHSLTAAGSGIGGISTAGFWDVVQVVPAANALTITVSLPDMSTFASTASDLRLLGWDGAQWVNLSGSTGASGLAEGSTLGGTLPAGGGGITALGIGSTAWPLAVEGVLHFAASPTDDRRVKLTWSIGGSEDEVERYEVERSADGRSFSGAVATQTPGKGSTGYQAFDGAPLAGENFYRVRTVGRDGSVAFSATRRVRFEAAPAVRMVYPTDNRDGIVHVVLADGADDVAVHVLNAAGQKVRVAADGQGLQRVLSLGGLPAGQYLIVVEGGGSRSAHRVSYRP